MIHFSKKIWNEEGQPSGKFSSLTFSQANSFAMNRVPRRHLSVTNAAFSGNAGNLLEVSSSGHEIDVTDEASVTVMLPVRGAVQVKHGSREHRASAAQVLSFGPSQRLTRVTPESGGHFEARMLKLPLTTELRLAMSHGPSDVNGGDPHIPSSIAAARGLSDLIGYVLIELSREGSVLRLPKSSLLVQSLVLEHLQCLIAPHTDLESGEITIAELSVRDAEEYMRAHYCEALTVGEIAAAVGLSPRQLQLSFRRATGCSPWTRLTAIRLEAARQRLCIARPEATVTSIVLDCGFTHLSRFSQLYRETFGELPSETLRMVRGT